MLHYYAARHLRKQRSQKKKKPCALGAILVNESVRYSKALKRTIFRSKAAARFSHR